LLERNKSIESAIVDGIKLGYEVKFGGENFVELIDIL
jgi:hypothetical protein